MCCVLSQCLIGAETSIRFIILLGRNQLGLFLWNLQVRKSYLRLVRECLFVCVYCCILKLCMSVHVCVLCSWRNSPRKSKAKFFSLLPETSDRLIRKSDDSNKMGWGVHSWDFAAYKMIALLLNDHRGTEWDLVLSLCDGERWPSLWVITSEANEVLTVWWPPF